MSFEDMDKFGNSYTFLAQHFHCVSSYTSESLLNLLEKTTEHCKVDQEFSSLNYKPSPNGNFGLKLLSNNDFDLDAIAKLKIGLKGSFVHILQWKTLVFLGNGINWPVWFGWITFLDSNSRELTQDVLLGTALLLANFRLIGVVDPDELFTPNTDFHFNKALKSSKIKSFSVLSCDANVLR